MYKFWLSTLVVTNKEWAIYEVYWMQVVKIVMFSFPLVWETETKLMTVVKYYIYQNKNKKI